MRKPTLKKETLALGGFALLLIAGASWYFLFKAPRVMSFDECVEAGNAVMESFPRQCRTADGRSFTEEIGFDVDASIENVALGNAVNLREGGYATYEDGLKLSIERFTDSRCPEDVQCIWEGQLGVNIRLEGGEIEDVLRLVLGAKQNPVGKGFGYTVTLENMTETVATLRVARETAEDETEE